MPKPSAMRANFTKLLREAANEKRSEEDEEVAINTQLDEAILMLSEWMCENNDLKLAQELAKQLEKESEAQKKLDIISGETLALKLAIEEKKLLKKNQDQKLLNMKSDEELARELLRQMEEEERRERQRQLDEDEELCRLILEKEKENYEAENKLTTDFIKSLNLEDDSDSKSSSPASLTSSSDEEELKRDSNGLLIDAVSKEVFFDGLEHKESFSSRDDVKNMLSLDLSDEKFGTNFISEDKACPWLTSANSPRLYSDEKCYLPPTACEEKSSSQNEQLIKLSKMKRKKEFEAKKRASMEHLYEKTVKNDIIVSHLWEHACVELDDVNYAVCLTLLLPNIKKLDIRILNRNSISKTKKNLFIPLKVKNNFIIQINAERNISNPGKVYVTPSNSNYLAEFQLDGKNLNIKDDSITYNYNSCTGLLHIYIENVSLNPGSTYESAPAAPTQEVNNASVFTSIKNSMLRIFSGPTELNSPSGRDYK